MSINTPNFSFEADKRTLNLKEVDTKLRETHKQTQGDLNNLKKEVIENNLFRVLRSEK